MASAQSSSEAKISSSPWRGFAPGTWQSRVNVREFIQRVFNGSAEPLLVHLVEDEKLTEQDVEEIRRSIKSSKKPRRGRSK